MKSTIKTMLICIIALLILISFKHESTANITDTEKENTKAATAYVTPQVNNTNMPLDVNHQENPYLILNSHADNIFSQIISNKTNDSI